MRLPLRYLCGSFLARFAEEGMGITMALLALQRSGSVGQAAALSAAWLAPHVLAAPLLGSLAARARRAARFYALCLTGVTAAMGTVTLLLGRIPLWLVCAIAVAGGCCGPAVSGGLSSLVADLLPRRSRDRGYAWDSATYNAASIAGVGAATAIAVLWSAAAAGLTLTAAAATAAVLIALLRRGHGVDNPPRAEPTDTATGHGEAASPNPATVNGGAARTEASLGPQPTSQPAAVASGHRGADSIADRDECAAPAELGAESAATAAGHCAAVTADEGGAARAEACGDAAHSPTVAGTQPYPAEGSRPTATAGARGAAPLEARLAGAEAGVSAPTGAGPQVGASHVAVPVPSDGVVGGAGEAPTSPSLRSDLVAGLAALWRNKVLRIVTTATCLAYLGIGGLTITAVLTARQWGGGDGGGVLVTAFSVGALAGALVLTGWTPSMPPQRLAAYCLAVTGIALGLAAFASQLWVAAVLFAIAGAGDGPLLSATLRVRAAHAPRRARAQVFTTGAALKLSAAALGAGLAGGLEALPPAVPLVLIAGTQLAASLLVWTLAPGSPEPSRA